MLLPACFTVLSVFCLSPTLEDKNCSFLIFPFFHILSLLHYHCVYGITVVRLVFSIYILRPGKLVWSWDIQNNRIIFPFLYNLFVFPGVSMKTIFHFLHFLCTFHSLPDPLPHMWIFCNYVETCQVFIIFEIADTAFYIGCCPNLTSPRSNPWGKDFSTRVWFGKWF